MTAKIKKPPKRYHHHPYRPRGVSHKAFRKVYWPYIPMLLIIVVLLFLNAATAPISALIRPPTSHVLAYATSMSTNGLLNSTNSARSQNGQKTLALNTKLIAAAQAKANDMASRNYWSHETPEGKQPWIFVTAQKYSYQKLGENLAAGFDDEQSTINGWLSSPPHRANLLDSAFSQVGFGFAQNANYTSAGGGPMTIVVAFYGKPQVLSATAATQPAEPTPPSVSASQPAKKPSPPAPAEPVRPPATTEQELPSVPLTTAPSRAQVALAGTSLLESATVLAAVVALAAGGIWASRHMLTLRRVFVHGESFVLRHPLMDIGLIVITALSFLLTRSAGIIQ